MKSTSFRLTPCLALCALLATPATLASCADQNTDFEVHYASDYPRTPLRLSVFGVFKDGRLSAESWDQLGKNLSSPFAKNACDVVYSDDLLAHAPDTASALDDYARANGVTDDLLDVYAGKAQGDAILLITVAGHPPATTPNDGSHDRGAASSPAMSPMRGRGPGRGGMPGGAMPSGFGPRNTDQNVFVMAASLYSVSLHHSVAEVGMTYSGKSVDEAVKSFHDKLASELRGASCVGWKPDVTVDPEKIRGIAQ
jgi:hypothetical protein